METRANALAVGVGVLMLIAGFIAFVFWTERDSWGKAKDLYTIYFQHSVSGLFKESIVNYQGVPVGVVKKIQLTPDLTRVKVTIALKNNLVLREGVKASLELQGLTGTLFVRLKGDGPPNAPLLKAFPGDPYPIIPSEPSPFENVVTSAPEVLHKLCRLLDEILPLFQAQNREYFSQILQNIEKTSASLAESMAPLEKLLTKAEDITQTLMKTAQAWEKVAHETQHLVHDNRKPLQDLLQESREVIQTLSQATEKLSRAPLRFLKGEAQEGHVLED